MRPSGLLRWCTVALLVTTAFAGTAAAASPAPAPTSPASATVVKLPPGGTAGYWLLGRDGGVFVFHALFVGSPASDPPRCPPNETDRNLPAGTCGAIAATPDGAGYWILNRDTGAVDAYGDAAFHGDPAHDFATTPREFVPNMVAIVSTPTGNGYWVLEAPLSGTGTVVGYGDATNHGDTTTLACGDGPRLQR